MRRVGGNIGGIKLVDFSMDAVYSSASAEFQRIPIQVIAPPLGALNWVNMKAKFCISYDTDTDVTGEAELYNFTDLASVENSQVDLPSVSDWTPIISPECDVTPGKSYSVRIRKTSGTGFVYIESANLILL